MSNDFSYKDLKEGEFRLLTISSVDGLLTCTLEHALIEDAPPYDALSYAWGTQQNTAIILCNEAQLSLTPSLLEALSQIRLYQSETSSQRRVWIDAICINQKNGGEKEVQVRRMEKIYSNAQLVLVCLGSAQNNSDMAMDHASELQEKLRSIGGVIHFDNLPSHGLEDQTHPLWPSFGHLLRRSWFERLWVVQEAVLPKKLVALCGSKWLDWEILSNLTMALLQTGLLHLALKDHEAQLNRDDGFFTIPSVNIYSTTLDSGT